MFREMEKGKSDEKADDMNASQGLQWLDQTAVKNSQSSRPNHAVWDSLV